MKRFLTISILCFALLPLRAQVATVEVSRPYDVNLDGIRKPAIPTSVDDSLQRFDVHFDYSIFNRPYGDLYDFTPYETIQLATVGANRTPFVYTRLGAQYAPKDRGIMPSGEIYLQTRPKNGFCSGLYGRHTSFFGVPGLSYDDLTPLYTNRMQNAVGGDLTYDWATGELMIDLQYNFDRYNYSGYDELNRLSIQPKSHHANNSLKASFNLNSAQKEQNMVYYDVTLAYRNTQKDFTLETGSPLKRLEDAALGESLLTVKGYVGASFDIHRIYVDMNIEHASYNGVRDMSAGVVEFSPFYQYDRKRLHARLGVKFGTRYGQAGEIPVTDADLTPRTNIFPDIDIRYTLVDKSLWVHSVLTGGNDLNPFSRMMDDSPIVYPGTEMRFGKRPFDATLSLESVIGGRLGINLEGNYKITRNKMYFVPLNDGTWMTQMTAAFSDVNQVSAQGEVFWKSQDLTLGGRLRYTYYYHADDKTDFTEMPAWTGYTFIRYNFRERIIVQAECNYRGATKGTTVAPDYLYDTSGFSYEVPPIVDVDLNVNYLINNHFSVFAKVGNLLNHRNQYMPLYLEPGINFGGGVCLNF